MQKEFAKNVVDVLKDDQTIIGLAGWFMAYQRNLQVVGPRYRRVKRIFG